jgi:glycine oxidase
MTPTIVVGGGIIGLAIGWRLAQHGVAVQVVDPQPGEGASFAAAGMLSPVSEAVFGEEALLALNQAAHARWPAFAEELAQASGIDVPLRTEGSLLVAVDEDDVRALEHLWSFQHELGLPVERLRSRACRDLEPMLTPRVRAGVRVDSEASVDNRVVCRALRAALRRAGGCLVHEQVRHVEIRDGRVRGVRLATGDTLPAGHLVVAAGVWTPTLEGLPPDAVPPVRPVKGQIIRLRFDPACPPLHRNVRAWARGWSVYLVPRISGELVVGATVEERGFDTTVTAGAVRELLTAAVEVLPVVAELELAEAIARLRPTTPDNAPVIGPTPVEGLLLATGHHRNGILLAPLTADAVVAQLRGTAPVPEVAPFGLERFGR